MTTFIHSSVRLLGVCAVVALASACSEAPQKQGTWSAAKKDSAPVAGTPAAVFKQGNWQSGDANAWAQQLRTRANYGMSDYQRVTN